MVTNVPCSIDEEDANESDAALASIHTSQLERKRPACVNLLRQQPVTVALQSSRNYYAAHRLAPLDAESQRSKVTVDLHINANLRRQRTALSGHAHLSR